MLLDLSEAKANLLCAAGNFLVVAGALCVLLGAVGSIWGDRVRSRYLQLRSFETANQTRDAIRDAAQANERSAAANERAAKLEKEAANARLSVEKLKNKLSWREISEQQVDGFCAATAGKPKAKIEVQYLNNDPESASFAAQLCEMFLKAGYDAPDGFNKMYGVSPTGGMMIGLNIKVPDPHHQAAIELQDALKKIDIDANGQVTTVDPGTIVLDVGQKPPPLSK